MSGTRQNLQVVGGVATFAAGDVVSINFQDEATPAPAGSFKDFGQAFGPRTGADQGGLTYGWVVPGTHDPLDLSVGGTLPGNGRNRGTPADPRLATLIHMQGGDLPIDGNPASGAFELSLANGTYSVLVSLGDSVFFDSSHGIDVEGTPAITAYTPSTSDPFIQEEVIVAVNDGTLTLTATGTNTKINFVEVRLAVDASGCGNGTVEPGESCDDGNVSSGDGCSAGCQQEGPCIPALSQFPGETLSTLRCEAVKVTTPFAANFTGGGSAGISDGAGLPIGFSMVLPSSDGTGYLPQNLALDVGAGELLVETTAGIQTGDAETQDNALGVGLALPNGMFRIETTIVDPPEGTGQYEQAGLWFGISESDYIKLAVMSAPAGNFIHALIEEGDVGTIVANLPIELPLDEVHLVLEADPALLEVRAFARIGGGAAQIPVATFTSVPDAWFSTDGAGIDFTVGTRSFAGIFATHRARSADLGSLTYRFSDFTVQSFVETDPGEPTPPTDPSDIDFVRFSVPVANPTAVAWGPDNRLYVATISGPIHALTFDFDNQTVISDEVTNVLSGRLVLGLAVDPDSTPDNVILWAGHSDVQQTSGDANSGMASRLSGPTLAVRQDVVTGLPRAIANHSTNSVHFGPDGRLYIAQGGNTGAGSANDSISEFGPRPEQPLSAAILVANVKDPSFDGSCTPTDDPLGAIMDATGVASRSVPCDVEVYASGMRNSYDFTFHSNGEMYAVDNGLGVAGAHPDLPPGWEPGDTCEGPVLGLDNVAAHNPGTRADILYRVEEGGFYGHPNPSRDECIFYGANPTAGQDGPVPETGGGTHFQEASTYPVGVAPDPNFRPAMYSFGDHKSTNAIIEYRSNVFCGALQGSLLVSYYSGFDQIRQLGLNAAGTAVVSDVPLRRSTIGAGGPSQLVDPLSMTQDPAGRIYVSELGAQQITVFDPVPGDCN